MQRISVEKRKKKRCLSGDHFIHHGDETGKDKATGATDNNLLPAMRSQLWLQGLIMVA